jgi:N-acetylglucosaminyl-diphospho-decaprenol L-rhamnosyltransferase
MDVSILIISYNTVELTLECIESVYAQTRDISFEVIVLDNDSVDGSADAIARRFPQVKLFCPGENLGFARGNNLAARLGATGRYLLLLNPDTLILDGAIQKVVAFADQHPKAGIVGGRTFFDDGTLNYNSCHGRPTLWSLICLGTGLASLFRRSRWLNPESLGSWKRDTVREVDAVTGCFLLINRALWDELGGFDESFFMYGEDTDLCLRAWAMGRSCMICPDAKLIHYGAQSDRVRPDKMVRLFRAKSRLFWKHWSPRTAPWGVSALKMWAFTRMAAFQFLRQIQPSRDSAYVTWREIWDRRAEFDAPST